MGFFDGFSVVFFSCDERYIAVFTHMFFGLEKWWIGNPKLPIIAFFLR